jgi:high-affinity Fe2+/Pb2+ permease
MGDSMVGQARRRLTGAWVVVGALAVVLTLLVLTFPYTGVSGCPGGTTLTTEGNGCVDNLMSWHGWVRFPHWDWLPWAYLAAIVGVIIAVVISVRRALRAR